jgi:hypothetical protein
LVIKKSVEKGVHILLWNADDWMTNCIELDKNFKEMCIWSILQGKIMSVSDLWVGLQKKDSVPVSRMKNSI